MGVRFACHACQRRLNVKNELAGKKGKCPSCGTRFRIPVSDSDFSNPLEGGQAVPDQLVSEQAASAQAAPEQPASQRHAADSAVEQDSPPAASDRQTPPAPTPPPPPPPVAPAPNDLLDADPSALWYVRPPSGGQYGPATGRLLKEWIGEGRVAPASLLWREGWAQWRRAEEILPHLLPTNETMAAGRSTEPAEPAAAPEVAAVEQPVSKPHPSAVGEPSKLREEAAAYPSQPPPPGRIKRQRKVQRVTIISVLVGLSILLLIVLIFVVISGSGQ